MPTIFQIPTFIQILEFIGTFAFAISGIRLASAKQFDWFGAYVAGVAVAIGGGTIRDVLLDVTPFWMTNPIYLICSALALLWVIFFRKHLIHMHNTFFIFDSIGLALFTVVGISKTIDLGYAFWVAIIMGTMTGAAGGVIRDVFINEIPLIFRKEIYAMACVIGGVIYWGLDRLGVDAALTQVISGCCIFSTRFGCKIPNLPAYLEGGIKSVRLYSGNIRSPEKLIDSRFCISTSMLDEPLE